MAIELLLQLVLGPLGAGLRFNAGDGGGRRLWEGKEVQVGHQKSGALVHFWTADVGATAAVAVITALDPGP